MLLARKNRGVALRKFIPLFLLIFYCSLWICSQDDGVLKIEASVRPEILSGNQDGKIVLKLSLPEGITIVPQPFFSVEFVPRKDIVFAKTILAASDLDLEILKENGEEYFNLDKPIEIPFKVSGEAERGKYRLEGKIKYFACSKEEGWCLKSTSKFFLSFSIRDTSVEKKLSIS